MASWQEEWEQIQQNTLEGTPERNQALSQLATKYGVVKGLPPEYTPEIVPPKPNPEDIESTAGQGLSMAELGRGLLLLSRPELGHILEPAREAISPVQEPVPEDGPENLEAPVSTFSITEKPAVEKGKGAFVDVSPGQAGQMPGAGGGWSAGRFGISGGGGGLGKYRQQLAKGSRQYGKALRAGQEKLTDIYGKQAEAIEAKANVEKAQAAAEFDIMSDRAQKMREFQAQETEIANQQKAMMEAETGKLKDSIESLRAMKIDPNRFFKHPDGSNDYGKKIGSAVAVALGALGSSLPARMGGHGGPNYAMQIIEKAIDRDIMAQQSDIDNKRAGVGLQMNMLGQMRQQFADDRQAKAAAKIAMLDVFKADLEKTAAMSGTKLADANMQASLAAVDMAQQKEYMIFERTAHENIQKSTAQQADLLVKQKQLGMQAADMAMRQQALMAKAMQSKGGRPLPASAVAKMADFRGAGGIMRDVRKAWKNEMEGNWTAGLSQYAPWATDAKSFDDMIRMAAQFIGKKLEGRMTDEDYDRMLRMLPQAGDSTERAMRKLDSVSGFLNEMETGTLDVYMDAGFDVSGFVKSAEKSKIPEGMVEYKK